jgi:putative SOS response-associated peptidase YedK
MCFTISVEKKAKEAILEYLDANEGVQSEIDFDGDYYLVSGFDHPKLPIIKQGKIELSEWGLIPSFAYSNEMARDIREKTLNARSDTIHKKPSYKSAIKNQRAILVVNGFFEWQHEGSTKIPYYIFPKDNTVFNLDCIYNRWTNKLTGETLDTFSIITTDANPMMEIIHNSKKRMPLIFSKSDINVWINPETDINVINNLMKPFPETEMDAYQISKNASNLRINRNYPGIKDRVDNPNVF